MLKKAGAYKSAKSLKGLGKDSSFGGLGGVGIENWLLQHGGSLVDASKDFLEIAEGKSFEEFEQDYSIINFGVNHDAHSDHEWPYDNFVMNNMRQNGYEAMKKSLEEFIRLVNTNEIDEEKTH